MNILITPSEIIEYLYCPRFTYFEYALNIPEHQEKRFKVLKGRNVHKEKARINQDYLRKKIGVTAKETEVYLCSEKHHVRGIVDEVLTLNDGTMAPLDYKFAEYKERDYKTLKTQSVVYGLLISENYGKPVNKGFVVYTRSKNRLVEMEFSPKEYEEVQSIIREMLLIIQKGYYPKKTGTSSKCSDCTYRNICV
ncbi:MAG: CRISPR-associated protein Cas4 [Desulfobacterales bacterium]